MSKRSNYYKFIIDNNMHRHDYFHTTAGSFKYSHAIMSL